MQEAANLCRGAVQLNALEEWIVRKINILKRVIYFQIIYLQKNKSTAAVSLSPAEY